MAVSAGIADMLCDVLDPLGRIVVRKMFGGAGVYAGSVMFAILDGDVLYLKTDASGQADFEAEGMRPFTYRTKTGEGKLVTYWSMPERLLDEPDELIMWARRALSAARAGAEKTIKAKRSVMTSGARRGKGEGANLRSSHKPKSKSR